VEQEDPQAQQVPAGLEFPEGPALATPMSTHSANIAITKICNIYPTKLDQVTQGDPLH
jgi:hypothetical protein